MLLHNFQLIRRWGEVAFGTVVLAKDELPGGPKQLYAIKALKKRSITSSSICQIVAKTEALVLIKTLYSCFQNKDYILFVMEYVSGGDAAEITLAVQFLHQHWILHRNLKLENVLVGSDRRCKVDDFGLSKLGLFRHCKASTQCGTPFCMAPETAKNLPCGQGIDWWAFGVMVFEMITGHPPFYYDEGEDSDDDSSNMLAIARPETSTPPTPFEPKVVHVRLRINLRLCMLGVNLR